MADLLEQQTGRAMGLGYLGESSVAFKRKFRWTFQVLYCFGGSCDGPAGACVVPEELVKVGARPQVDIEETEINYLHGKMWIPGKATWQTMTVTYYDVSSTTPAPSQGTIANLFGWLASVYDFTDPVNLYMGTNKTDYEGVGLLYLYDGCGNSLEGWQLNHLWPQSINFGELDMSSSDECTVELTLRYSDVIYHNYCGADPIKCACNGCSS